MEAIIDAMWDFFYGMFVSLDSIIYKFAGYLYQIYMMVSSARIFKTETYEIFVSRIYAILGVVMLFVLAYSLLQSIVNPDNFSAKSDTSMGKIVTNTIISIVLIAIIPTIFNFMYEAQEILLTQNIIGKLILGRNSTASSSITVDFSNDQEVCDAINNLPNSTGNNSGCKKTYRSDDGAATSVKMAGNSIAVDIFSAFIYPYTTLSENNTSSIESSDNPIYSVTYNFQDLVDFGTNLKKGDKTNKDTEVFETIVAYNLCHNNPTNFAYGHAATKCADDVKVVTSDEDRSNKHMQYSSILQYAKSTGDFSGFKLISSGVNEQRVEYSWGISTIAGVFLIYIFASYCLDMGLRAAKLGFAQLVAPIPILARILPKQKSTFDSWVKFTMKAYFEVFLRIAIIFLGIFLITNLPSMDDLWDGSMLTTISIMSTKIPLLMKVSPSWGVLMFSRVIIIIGILMFIKQAPTLIHEALGINVNAGSLSIKSKLGNMFGVDQLKNSRALGFTSGAIGAGYMSAKNGGGFFRAAFKGGQEGMKSRGWQFNKQGQAMYRETTGDKFNGSLLPGSRRSLSGNINYQLDMNNRRLRNQQKENLENFRDEFESSTEFKNRMRQQTITLENGKKMTLENYEEEYQNSRNSIAQQASEIRHKAQQEAQEFKKNEAEAIAKRKEAFEKSAAYNNAMAIARGRAASMADFHTKTSEEQKAIMSQFLNEEISKNNSSEAQSYLKDLNRDIESEAHSIITEANNKAKELIKTEEAKAKETLENGRSKIIEATKKDIKSNPKSKAEQRYNDARNELKARGEFENDKNIRRALGEMFENKDNK